VRAIGVGLLGIGAIAMVAGIWLGLGSQHLRVEAVGLVIEGFGALLVVVGGHVIVEGWWSR
jgi:hypothetical protein